MRALFKITSATILYASLSLAFSLFTLGNPIGRTIEYTRPTEFYGTHSLGHIVIGLTVGALSFDIVSMILTAILSVVLDVDHALSVLGFQVNGRPSHSLVFIILSTIIIGYLLKVRPSRFNWKVGAATLSSFLLHIAYDAQTTNAGVPIFLPFTNNMVQPNCTGIIMLYLVALLVMATSNTAIMRVLGKTLERRG